MPLCDAIAFVRYHSQWVEVRNGSSVSVANNATDGGLSRLKTQRLVRPRAKESPTYHRWTQSTLTLLISSGNYYEAASQPNPIHLLCFRMIRFTNISQRVSVLSKVRNK